ncbi:MULTISPECIES: hypothetical protein [Nostoc]|uniref:Flagellar assembly protein H n=1 Tax=Nostoc paludosum FACHB-159 TaxID=2692908 RepID=A0ABR8KLL9_9NOSO|nr:MULTISPECIES: hypothetical protein [Nostoc]MBD2682582.1 hypothetical protein [Nostoc sp. FACHB-857]MBD2738922.1 hypothetical protein [Nostoc paludosum FACHB-159]
MTRFIHDQFAKDYLEELLKPYGEVQAPSRVAGEVREIDVFFSPVAQQTTNLATLGLLGKFATNPAIFEPFRNVASKEEICDCLLKLLEVRGALQREANKNQTPIQELEIPKLWILTPTASTTLLSGFRAVQGEDWLPGVHFMADYLRTAIVAIHQLPQTLETLWLRILGRGRVQEQAINELKALPPNHPFQKATLELVYNLRQNLRVNQNLEEDDKELIMRLEPLYQQDREQAKLEGERLVVENLLQVRFGSLDNNLQAIIEPLLALPPQEFTPLLMQLSREELIARFGRQS